MVLVSYVNNYPAKMHGKIYIYSLLNFIISEALNENRVACLGSVYLLFMLANKLWDSTEIRVLWACLIPASGVGI